MYLSAELCQLFLIDAGERHIRIGDDRGAVMQRFYGFLHGIFGKMQRFGVLEIRRGVNNTLNDGKISPWYPDMPLFKLFCDNLHAGALNIGGQMMLRCHFFPPLGLCRPMAA